MAVKGELPRLGDLFTGWDGLDLGTRRQLAVRLRAPGRPPPLLPGELSTAPLPRRREELQGLLGVVEAGLGPNALFPLVGQRFADVVPGIQGRTTDITSAPCPGRLKSLLEQNRVTTWDRLGELTLADIRTWFGAGPTVMVALVWRAINVGAFALAEAPGWSEEAAGDAGHLDHTADDLALLLGRERSAGTNELRHALLRYTDDRLPNAVRAAAERLLNPISRPGSSLAALDHLLSIAGDERDRLLFERLTLDLHGQFTGTLLAAVLEVSVERARQIRLRADARVRSVIEALPRCLHQEVANLSRRLGAAAPLDAVDEALAAVGLPALPDSRSLLLLWLTGPYRITRDRPGWIATDPVELWTETRRMLDEDGGVRSADQVAKELDVLGLTPVMAMRWLAELPVRRLGDLLVLTDGRLTDVAERALSALGRSMTVEELEDWCGGAGQLGDHRGLWPVLSRDGRFVQVSEGAFELTEWGTEPYDEMPIPSDSTGQPGRPQGSPCAWLHVEIDDAVLCGGEGAAVPAPLVERLGLPVGEQRTFATRYGPVTLSNGTKGPIRSPLRHVALASGAAIGDAIIIGFTSGSGDAHVDLVPGNSPDTQSR